VTDPEKDAEDLAAAERELHDAIAAVLGRRGMMVTKWMLVAEILDGDGVRALESFASPDIRAWDTIGILGYLDARERGAIAAEFAGEAG
jgi:hypothetical protein